MGRIYDVRHWDGLRWHDTYILSFMKIGVGVQAILRFCLRNLRGYNVGFTDGSWLIKKFVSVMVTLPFLLVNTVLSYRVIWSTGNYSGGCPTIYSSRRSQLHRDSYLVFILLNCETRVNTERIPPALWKCLYYLPLPFATFTLFHVNWFH
jgi:hypothetical protein